MSVHSVVSLKSDGSVPGRQAASRGPGPNSPFTPGLVGFPGHVCRFAGTDARRPSGRERGAAWQESG